MSLVQATVPVLNIRRSQSGSSPGFPATEEFYNLWSACACSHRLRNPRKFFCRNLNSLMRLLTCSMCSSSKAFTSLQFSSGASRNLSRFRISSNVMSSDTAVPDELKAFDVNVCIESVVSFGTRGLEQ